MIIILIRQSFKQKEFKDCIHAIVLIFEYKWLVQSLFMLYYINPDTRTLIVKYCLDYLMLVPKEHLNNTHSNNKVDILLNLKSLWNVFNSIDTEC